MISNANLKSRDMILQAKEELADDILEKVLERLKKYWYQEISKVCWKYFKKLESFKKCRSYG